MHITATFATIIIIIIIIILFILFFFYYYNLNGSQNERGRFYQKKSINRTASNLVLLNEKSSSLCLHSYLVFCCACVLICTLHGCSGKFQTQTCTLFFFSFYISKFCRLKSVVTSISLNPRVATNLKKKKRKKKREKKYKMIFSRQSALKMFSTETPFKVQESSAYSPPLSPSSQCFKVVIRCDSLSKPQWGFYTIRAAVPSYLGGILLAM